MTEQIIWKVFHNKYLFRYILNQIENNDWLQYDDIKDIHIDSRIKFKKITSLQWMVQKEQYQLLICKLENKEFIEIKESAISILHNKMHECENFKEEEEEEETPETKISGNINEIGYYRINDELKYLNEKKETSIENQSKQSLLKRIISLLFKNYIGQLKELNLFKDTYKASTFLTDQIFKCKEIEIDIYEILNNVVKNMEPIVLDTIIQNLNIKKQTIPKKFKNKSISKAFSSYNPNEMVEYIINNDELFNLPKPSDGQVKKKFKNENGSSSNKKDKVVLLSLCNVLQTIKCSDTIKKLLKLGYIEKEIHFTDYIKNQINEIISSFKNDETNEEDFKLKKLYIFYSNNKKPGGGYMNDVFKDIKSNCILKYDSAMEIGNEDIGLVYTHAMGTYSLKSTQYLLSEFNNEEPKQPLGEYCFDLKVGNYSKITNQFIQLYSKGYNFLKNKYVTEEIKKFVYSSKSLKDFQTRFNLIENKQMKSNFIQVWDNGNFETESSINYQVIIKDTKAIDWINENIEIYSDLKLYKTLKFQTYNLLKYAFDKYPLTFNNLKVGNNLNDIYEYCLSWSILNCDIKSLDQLINNLPNGFKIKKFYRFNQPNKLIPKSIADKLKVIPFNYNNENSTQPLIKLLNYLNLNGWKCFEPKLFKSFIKCTSSTNDGILDMSSLTIDLSQFDITTIKELFIYSIRNTISPNIIKIILNNFQTTGKPISKLWDGESKCDGWDNTFFNFQENGEYVNYLHSCLFYITCERYEDIGPFYCNSGESTNDIILSIDLMLSIYNTDINGDDKTITMVQDVINYLFKRLIKTKNIDKFKLENVVSKIKLSSNGKFQFQHSLYHSFYYLGIKSLKFIKLILNLPALKYKTVIYQEDQDPEFDYCNVGYEDPDFYNVHEEEKEEKGVGNILKLLDLKVFSYDFIFNSSFQVIFKELSNQLIWLPIEKINIINNKIGNSKHSNSFTESLESTLLLLLEIKEIDLFFDFLSKIQDKLNDINWNIKDDFPQIIKEEYIIKPCDYPNCQYDLDQPIIGNRIFKFSSKLISGALKVLDSTLFEKFIKFCLYQSIKGNKHLIANNKEYSKYVKHIKKFHH